MIKLSEIFVCDEDGVVERLNNIIFDTGYEREQLNGVITALNGDCTILDILHEVIRKLSHEREGVRLIAELDPGYELMIQSFNYDLVNRYVDDKLFDINGDTIIITEEIVERAEDELVQYGFLLDMLISIDCIMNLRNKKE